MRKTFAERQAQPQGRVSSGTTTTPMPREQLILQLQKEAGNQAVRRVFTEDSSGLSGVPRIVHEALKLPGRPLDAPTAAFMESRFGHDFSHVRVHTDWHASESAKAVGAQAYTAGRNIVFADGQFEPHTSRGQRLLAHELAHVLQQATQGEVEPKRIGSASNESENEADRVSEAAMQAGAPHSHRVFLGSLGVPGTLQRTPASKVDCASTAPLKLPNGGQVDDPVGVITAAEQRARALLDSAIGELESTRQRILSGSPPGWPTVSDTLGFALELLGLNPNSEKVWTGKGSGTAALLLLRLQWVRREIGSGSFFFTCLGAEREPSGSFLCGSRTETETEVIIKEPALARTGGFHTYLCEGFWKAEPEDQALILIHEAMHTFGGEFIQDELTHGMHVAACYERFVAVVSGSPDEMSKDSCPLD